MRTILKRRVILAAMAGICDGDFCFRAAKSGAGMVTLGGLNFDEGTVLAGEMIRRRGRKEFDVKLDSLERFLREEVSKALKGGAPVAINVRAATLRGILFAGNLVSKSGATALEIDAHCRQPEMMAVGAGQALLNRLETLSEWIMCLKESFNVKVILKWRGNVVDDLTVAKLAEKAGADAIHIDAMKQGVECGDLELIRKISENVNVFLIGNNSVRDVNSAIEMLNSGADAVSIARATLNDPSVVGKIALGVEEKMKQKENLKF
ncbi:MAG: tRNA-dihydrouridine synthase [Candidatus Jordarchaeales archaeon]